MTAAPAIAGTRAPLPFLVCVGFLTTGIRHLSEPFGPLAGRAVRKAVPGAGGAGSP